MFPPRMTQVAFFRTLAFASVLSACSLEPVGPEQAQTVPRLTLPKEVSVESVSEARSDGVEAFQRGNYPASVRYFEAATKLDPGNTDAWLGLAAAADRSGHFEISAGAYDQLFELLGPSVEYYNNRGFSFLLQGRLFAARIAFEDGLRFSPRNQTLMNNLTLVDKLEGRRLAWDAE